MKRHYYSTAEKKPVAIIHTTIRSSKSLQITGDILNDSNQHVSSVRFFLNTRDHPLCLSSNEGICHTLSSKSIKKNLSCNSG